MRDQKPSLYNAVISFPREFSDFKLGIRIQAGMLAALDYLPAATQQKQPDNFVAQAVVEQLANYFIDPTYPFILPLYSQGTSFQQRVWQCLLKTKVSKVYSYSEIAAQVGSSARAVGNACRANPVPIVVPCHRVVAKKGVGGYCGQIEGVQITMKQWLLQHEISGLI